VREDSCAGRATGSAGRSGQHGYPTADSDGYAATVGDAPADPYPYTHANADLHCYFHAIPNTLSHAINDASTFPNFGAKREAPASL
jgi:hypothetical protein